MSEAIWIELIKVLPAFLWIGFGFIALAIAKRIFTAQAPRMTKVETPWVTVELAQQAIEQATVRGPEPEPVRPDPDFGLWPPGPEGAEPPHDMGGEAGHDGPLAAPPYDPSPPGYAPRQRQPVGATPPADDKATNDTPDSTEPSAPQSQPPVEQGETIPVPPDLEPLPVTRPPDSAFRRRSPYPPLYSNPPYNREPLPELPYGPQAHALGVYGRPPSDAPKGLRAAKRLAYAADRLQGGAILWVDDQQEWNEPLIRLFRTAGMTVDAVSSTDEALHELRRGQFDLVITDMRREREPGGDDAGTELLDRMVAMGVPTPAVFFSDHPGVQTNLHPRAVIATSDPEQLVDTVVDIVGTRSRPAPSTWLDRIRGT
ncbi:response regulator [Glycomyces sp. NPDC046736]|uniref:response regulator n=1 Tax=Glycomyces sp. NPDC046736 TaxID=3155615 RepID=UPI0033C13EAF